MSFDASSWVNNLYTMPPDAPQGAAAVQAWGRNAANAATQASQGYGQAGLRMLKSYENEYQPYDRQFMRHVDNIGTDSYRAQQRGQAMTDIGMQAGQQMQAMNRNMARMGIDPTSGAAARMGGLMAQQTALNKVVAAMGADRSARDEWAKGLGVINAMGKGVNEMSNKTAATATGYGDFALKALGTGVQLRNDEMRASPSQGGISYVNQGDDSWKKELAFKELDLKTLMANNDHTARMAGVAANLYGTTSQDASRRAASDPGNVFLSQVGGNLATGVGNAVGGAFKSWISQPRSGSSGSASAPGFGEWGGDPSYYDTSVDYSGDFWA